MNGAALWSVRVALLLVGRSVFFGEPLVGLFLLGVVLCGPDYCVVSGACHVSQGPVVGGIWSLPSHLNGCLVAVKSHCCLPNAPKLVFGPGGKGCWVIVDCFHLYC